MAVEERTIVIVGCGLAGLSLALGLVAKSQDLSVILIEKRENFESRGATFGLAQNGQKALQEMCPSVLETLKEEGILMAQSGGYMLPWWVVRDTLLREVQKHEDRIEIRLGTTIEDLIEDESGVKVRFEGSNEEISANALVGADGVHSFVRTTVLGLPEPTKVNAYVWRGNFSIEDNPDLKELTTFPTGKFVKFDEHLLMYFNFAATTGRIPWTFTSSDVSLIESGTISTPIDLLNSYKASESGQKQLEKDVKDFEQAIAAFSASGKDELEIFNRMAVVDLTDSEAVWGGKGRVTLIGDAAHSIRPASGLGGSLAFEDAVLLSRALTSGVTNSNIQQELRHFEARRLPRVKSISRDQSLRSELAYTHGWHKITPWDEAYKKWIFAGPDAPSQPPCDPADVLQHLIS